MPPAKRVSKKTTVILDTVIDPVPVPDPAPVPTPAVVVAPKKQKKQPKIVAVVTPDGIEGSFLPEPRRPLIAHLQVNSTEVKFHDVPIPYDPNPPSQPEPYDAMADNFFTGQNENILIDAKEVVADTKEVVEEVKAQPSMQAFMKIDLMVEYSQTKISKKLPDTTDIACFWCAHGFKGQPSIIPEREEKGVSVSYTHLTLPTIYSE